MARPDTHTDDVRVAAQPQSLTQQNCHAHWVRTVLGAGSPQFHSFTELYASSGSLPS